jgi:hypothetical protein
MCIVVTHTSRKIIAASALRGPLGDVPVPIIDVADHDTINELYALAERIESKNNVSIQRGVRSSAHELEEELAKVISQMKNYGRGSITSALRPAILSRACPFICAQPKSTLPK